MQRRAATWPKSSLVPSRLRRFRMWRHLSSLSEKFAIVLGSKPPLVTRIARTGLGTRLTQVLVCRLDGARKGFNLNDLIWEILCKPLIEKKRFGSLFSTLQKNWNGKFYISQWLRKCVLGLSFRPCKPQKMFRVAVHADGNFYRLPGTSYRVRKYRMYTTCSHAR